MKRFSKFIAVLTLASVVTGSAANIAFAHGHHHTTVSTPVVTSASCWQNGFCTEDGSCDVNGVCQNGGVCTGSITVHHTGGHHSSFHH